jgi:hypothetical protein
VSDKAAGNRNVLGIQRTEYRHQKRPAH